MRDDRRRRRPGDASSSSKLFGGVGTAVGATRASICRVGESEETTRNQSLSLDFFKVCDCEFRWRDHWMMLSSCNRALLFSDRPPQNITRPRSWDHFRFGSSILRGPPPASYCRDESPAVVVGCPGVFNSFSTTRTEHPSSLKQLLSPGRVRLMTPVFPALLHTIPVVSVRVRIAPLTCWRFVVKRVTKLRLSPSGSPEDEEGKKTERRTLSEGG